MFDRIASIAKPYVQRFKKAMSKAMSKAYVRTAVGLATITGAGIVYRSLTNAGKDDWLTEAFNFASDGDTDILIAANSRNGSAVVFPANDLVANTLADRGGMNVRF